MYDFTVMHRAFSFLITALMAACLTLPADALALRELQFLEDPRTHAILHTAPALDPDTTRNVRRDECNPRHDLTGPGRILARRVGVAIQKAGVRVDSVLSSPRCDAAMTARLLELVPSDEADFLSKDPPEGWSRQDQVDEALVYLAGQRPLETSLLVTHGAVITALTGVETAPGQMLIVEVSALGEMRVLYSIAP